MVAARDVPNGALRRARLGLVRGAALSLSMLVASYGCSSDPAAQADGALGATSGSAGAAVAGTSAASGTGGGAAGEVVAGSHSPGSEAAGSISSEPRDAGIASTGSAGGPSTPGTPASAPDASQSAAGSGGSLAASGSSGQAGASGSAAAAGGSGGSASSPQSGAGGAPNTGPLTVFIAGDSTVSTYPDTASDRDQAGWGQMLPDHVRAGVKVENRAIGGRTARRFIDDGRLDEIFADIRAGDYLLVQFGTNDGNKTATYMLGNQTIPYYLEPNTDFKTYLKKYLDGARMRGAIPVLVTPPPRNSAYCTGGNGTGAWAQAMRELGQAEHVVVADLNQKSVDYLKAICPEPSPPDFYLQRSDGTVDGTHFQERGARKLAEFVADALRDQGVGFVK